MPASGQTRTTKVGSSRRPAQETFSIDRWSRMLRRVTPLMEFFFLMSSASSHRWPKYIEPLLSHRQTLLPGGGSDSHDVVGRRQMRRHELGEFIDVNPVAGHARQLQILQDEPGHLVG